MHISMRTFLLLRLLAIAAITTSIGSCNGNLGVPACRESEKQALLIFKQDLTDPSNLLSSWVADEDSNCCRWDGVVCDYSTGHIHELHLDNPDALTLLGLVHPKSSLGGKINPSLLNLTHLTYLNLSNNCFQGTQIPSFFGSLKSLTHLDLSHAWFEGLIPHQLGNLSSLSHLFLGGGYNLKIENLQWISGLSRLRLLDLSYVDLSKASDHWPLVINMLPSLVELNMTGCELDHIPSLPIVNFTSLAILDLSFNSFNSFIPGWVFSLRNLVSLRLESSSFQGPIPSSPNNITSLREIDLSGNYELNGSIPEWLFNNKELTHLNLESNALVGPLPDGMVNMTGLKVLNLGWNTFNSTIPEWLYSCNSLESLLLSQNNFQGGISSSIGNMTSIINLELDNNLFEGKIPKSLRNLCKLMVLDLSHNQFTDGLSDIFETLSECASNRMETLSLGSCNLSGQLPELVGTFTNLSSLDLSNNSISGPIPVSLGNLIRLKTLDICYNQFNGTLPESIGQLKMLYRLDISYNSFQGVVSEAHFTHLTELSILHGSGNSLTLRTSRDWIPPFQRLRYLLLASWHLGPDFPMWIQKLFGLGKRICLSGTGLSGTIPTWVWNSSIGSLNLSHNHLHGEVPGLAASMIPKIDLSSNQFNGSLPLVSSSVWLLDLSNSSFSGSVSHFFCDTIDGPKQLEFLHLENNHLDGRIPDCWMNWESLRYVNLESNSFTGNIPSSMGHLPRLASLHLRNNQLSGQLPSSLQNCTELLVVDLSLNKLEGSLPPWIGNSTARLVVLNLRSNKFQGDIPHELCNLKDLQILDIAKNNLSGTIPRCFNSLSSMKNLSKSAALTYSLNWTILPAEYEDNAFVVTKGKEAKYSKILRFVKSMDISANVISGQIPEELTSLIALQTLNLSNNLLMGKIPSQIGNLRVLETLDLSKNQFSGVIPTSMRSMTFLNHLNVSYNNLTGRIPESTQLQSFDLSSFVGNKLCGPPLIKTCNASKVIPLPPTVEQERGYDLLEDKWFYLSLGLGFAVGFWSILGSLLVNLPWSLAFSRFLNSIVLKLYAVIVGYV